MSLFTEWNSLLLEEYFSPAKADQDVWIPTTRLELEGIGVHKGGANGLVEAVKQGPAWFHGSGDVAKKAQELVRQRLTSRNHPDGYSYHDSDINVYQDSKAPPYLPYIALWVLSRSEAGESGFYAKVSELVCDPFLNNSNTRQQMEYVWADLEHWSIDQQKGRFGKFKLNVLGKHRFVGMAYAQTMVTHKDMDGISSLFGSCRLHPGQALDNSHFMQLLEHGQNSNFLSAGLKAAMGKEDYWNHLKQLLSIYLEFWDGRVPKRTNVSSGVSNKQVEFQQGENDELSIILQLKNSGESLCWEVGWRLPAVVTGLCYAIKVDDGEETEAKLEVAGTHIHCVSSVNQNDARRALGQSARKEVDSTLSYAGSDGERNERKIYLRHDKVRVLVEDKPDPSLHDSYLEREMPLKGPVYLLYSRIEYLNLELFLENEEIKHELLYIDGLPDDWSLICINCTENLTPEQRAVIVDEEPVALAKARIRLVGGKPVIGAGSKKYAYYDLPLVELEAPVGAELTSAGLTFEELVNADNGCVRRFKYSLDDGSVCAFKIKAQLGDEILCTAGLQVLAAGGVSSTHRPHFSIDNFGRPLANANGLCGAIIGDTQAGDLDLGVDYFHVDEKALVNSNGIDVWECMELNVSSQFLDSIALTIRGSMTYGVARDQIRRLASNIGIDDIEPALLIRELRRRGHVEIETDVKGHMVRIFAVPPTLYSLPIKDAEQRQLYGICGSLRLQQWKELAQAAGIRAFVEIEPSYNFPVVRIAPDGQSAISSIAKSANFLVVALPVKQLSQWLGSVKELKENLSWYHEQGFTPNYLEKLNPVSGKFSAEENILVDSDRKFELFRYEDPQIQGLRVYKLGRNLGDGFSKYSFIQDSRWGVWMAVSAFAEYVNTIGFFVDASPWPIYYDSVNGCLWLPARMEPPFVIERALTLCAGTGPIVMQALGKADGDSILLSEKGLHMIGKVSSVYYDMADGKWLCYRWVPEVIARHVAHLLGGELRAFGC
ncbi:hypothetical protein [Neptunomonas antarctica]|uniref:Uncharacterized protein n=1 Tax=Neptunomonas antarctica TaxID=619304 RepID=A0A1N7IVT0_9GAMM|nr:hypothetical protein [Neptunomonas antarctica]SIS41195.1 hypothetical protein SAMN05421760_101206 [Neptunomonas antarctica]